MSSKILFTHSYFYRFDKKQWRFKQPYPPLGTIQAAAVIRDAGFNVSLFDTNLRSQPEEIADEIRKFSPKYLVIYDDGFNYLTKMCLTKMREAAFSMTRIAKKFGCTVIICSSDATDHYEKYFPFGADYVIRGEGEESLKELLACLEKRIVPDQVAGMVFKKSGKTFSTENRPVIKDLDTLPLPAWDLVDITSYKKIWMRYHGYFSLNIATTRGCPFKCNWCAKPIYGNRYTSRSPEHVVREIQFLKENYHPDHIWFCDDIFGLKPGWVNRFRNLIVEKNIFLRYKIQSRVDLLMENDVVEALKESGAETVWVGAESGSQKILDAMDKGTSVSQIKDATHLLKSHGIKVAFFLQFGYLGETQEDILKTIDMVIDLLPDEVGISISYPLPGTKFYETVKDQLKEKRNWRDSDDLAMMFDSTYNSEYYRLLHRYVHSIYRKHKGYSSLRKLFTDPLRLNYRDLRAGLATFYYLPKSFAHQLKLKQLQTA